MEGLRGSLEPSQYTSKDWLDALANIDARASMGRVGACWDNAAAESWFGGFKVELVHPIGAFTTRHQAQVEIARYIRWHNTTRRHSALRYPLPPTPMGAHPYPDPDPCSLTSQCPRSRGNPNSAFYSKSFVRACRDRHARFSVTVKQLKPIKKAIAAIPDTDRVPIDYWLEGGADVAETTYTAFTNTKHEITLRLIVHRVRSTSGSQLALDVMFDYHPILTDRHGDMLELEADHRAHAVVELAIRDLKAGGLAHVPSGKFNANAAWLALAILAHNLGRWSLNAPGQGWQQATTETLRTKLVSMPARLVHTARRIKLRAPTNWAWREPFENALARIAVIPAPT